MRLFTQANNSDRQTGQPPLKLLWDQDSTTTFNQRVTGEQVSLMAYQRQYESIGSALLASVAVFTLWSVVDHKLLLVWFALMLMPGIVREYIVANFQRVSSDITASSHPLWAYRLCLCSAVTGIMWGCVTAMLPVAALPQIAVLITLHGCYIALAASAAYLPAFYAFAAPSTLIFLGFILSRADSLLLPYMPMLAALLAAACTAAHRNSLNLVSQIRLRLDSDEQAARYALERDQSELALLAKNQFLSEASHDLRQPVHAIGLFAGLLEVRLRHQDTGGVLGKIQQSIAALSSLFDSILDISSLDAGAVNNTPQHMPLQPLLQRIECEHSMQAHAKQLSLTIDCQPDLSALVDPTLLERVLTNLVGNAIKYTNEGAVTVTAREEGDRLAIVVNDTGRGIPESEQERVFSEYHQLRETGRNRTTGQGLGLAIVKRMCKLMDVPINLASKPGKGSVFSLSLARSESNTAESTDLQPCDKALWCRRVLVVDNEQDILDGMRHTLTSWGCQAITARTTAAALQNFAKTHQQGVPDVLIIDSCMDRGESTEDAIRAVREEYNTDIPVLVITGEIDSAHLTGVHERQVRVLHKPLPPERLYEVLDELSGRDSRQNSELVQTNTAEAA